MRRATIRAKFRGFDWDYDDKGVCFDGRLLDLTVSGVSVPAVKEPVVPVSCSGIRQQHSHSSQVSASFLFRRGSPYVTVRYRGDDKQKVFSINYIDNCFKLQVTGGIVALYTQRYTMDMVSESCIYYVNRKGSEDTEMQEVVCLSRKEEPAGLAVYNGMFYYIDMPTRYHLRVSRAPSGQGCNRRLGDYMVYQDEERPRYCLMYKGSGIVTGLVDLEFRRAAILSERVNDLFESDCGAYMSEEYFLMVGVSNGSVGVWKYSKQYLIDRFRDQHQKELPDLFLKALGKAPLMEGASVQGAMEELGENEFYRRKREVLKDRHDLAEHYSIENFD